MPIERKQRDGLIKLLDQFIHDLRKDASLPHLMPDELHEAAEDCENIMELEGEDEIENHPLTAPEDVW